MLRQNLAVAAFREELDCAAVVAANVDRLLKHRGLKPETLSAVYVSGENLKLPLAKRGISKRTIRNVVNAKPAATGSGLHVVGGVASRLGVPAWMLLVPALNPDDVPALRTMLEWFATRGGKAQPAEESGRDTERSSAARPLIDRQSGDHELASAASAPQANIGKAAKAAQTRQAKVKRRRR
jgi:hypothetical protein